MNHYPSQQTVLRDRTAAGKSLVEPLLKYAGRADVIVLALPRGGVPVHKEFAMGAIASGGIQIVNEDALRANYIDQSTLEAVVAREGQELQRRERAYRATRAPIQLQDQVVILVDDGLATGASMMAAVHAVRLQKPARIVVAVPVAPVETAEALRSEVDELVCPLAIEWMMSIGNWYMNFSQTSDEEVIDLLQRAWQRESEPERGAP
jgi:predicted phosphoribosyltransferase